ncbi:hypothetical protein [Isoptericola aurantiacus]
MTLALTLTLAGGIAWLVALRRTVRNDGLGARRPPRSHRDWWEGADPG